MGAAQAGDAISYQALLTEVAQWLHRYFSERLPAAMMDDAVQDVLPAIHEKRHTFEPRRPFGPWLDEITRYKLTK